MLKTHMRHIVRYCRKRAVSDWPVRELWAALENRMEMK